MIKTNVYDSYVLMKRLGEKYSFQKLPYTTEYGEDYDEYGVFEKEGYFITTLPNIKKVYTYFSAFGSDTEIFLNDGTELHLSTSDYKGKNDIINLRENKILSCPLDVKGRFIEVDERLNDWLVFNDIKAKELSQMRIEVLQEEIFEFPFDEVAFDPDTGEIVGTNYKKKLKIKEKELMKALSQIEDKKIAYKIQYILEKVNNLRLNVKD